jgi:hypothetical protein
VLARRLLETGSRLVWAQVGLLNLWRSVATLSPECSPTFLDNTDVGDRSEKVGVAALFVEGSLALLSAQIIVRPADSDPARTTAGAGTVNQAVLPAQGAAAADRIAS